MIDAHLHVWERARSNYPWIVPADWLDADFLPEAVMPDLEATGVDAAILVQADDTYGDTAFMLDVSRTHSWVVGVVGWVPLERSDEAESALVRWMQNGKFRGVRQLIHDDPRNILELPDVIRTLRMLAEAKMTFDVPDAWPRNLAAIARVADRIPDLTIGVDHLGKPPIGQPEYAEWRSELQAIAARPNTFAKLSGLQGLTKQFSADRLREAWDDALEAFGPSRLAWGSDWPMTVPYGGYSRAWAVTEELVRSLSDAEQHEILAGTARRAYRLASE